METKHELHPDLHDASLEKACEMANGLIHTAHMSRATVEEKAFDLSYMLEYLRLNFDLVPKK
jgi:hypothetical protein